MQKCKFPDFNVKEESVSENIDDLIKEVSVSEHPLYEIRFEYLSRKDIFSLQKLQNLIFATITDNILERFPLCALVGLDDSDGQIYG
jgi:hypothetical protein